jgi:Plasmid encoded RepA protein
MKHVCAFLPSFALFVVVLHAQSPSAGDAAKPLPTTIFFGTSDQPDAKLLLDWVPFYFFDRLHLWFHHDEPATVPASSAQNLIVLSEAFCDEIDQHRIPVEREIVALLANAPAVLDLCVWLVWKT